MTAGGCHEKLRLIVVTDAIWNISGGLGAGREEHISKVVLSFYLNLYSSTCSISIKNLDSSHLCN